MLDVLIVGGGPAGMAAAVWCQRLGLKSLLLEKNMELGGQLLRVNNPVIDYLGLPVSNGKELAARFAHHVQEMGCPVQCGHPAERIDVQGKTVFTRQGRWTARSLILAMGCREKRLGVPGEEEMMARGEVYSASRDRLQFRGRTVAVIGGGDRALEGALLLAEAGAQVELIHHSSRFRARPGFRERVLAHRNIRLHQPAHVRKIVGDSHVTGIEVEKEGQLDTLAVAGVFVRIGVEPNVALVQGQVRLNEAGYIVTGENGETSVEHVYAIGDLSTLPLFSSISLAVGQAAKTVKYLSARLFHLPL